MFWKTIGRWALVVVAVPLAAAGLRKMGQRIESNRGPSRSSRLLKGAASGMDTMTGRGRRAVR